MVDLRIKLLDGKKYRNDLREKTKLVLSGGSITVSFPLIAEETIGGVEPNKR